MLISKTKAEMVAEWRLRKGLLPPATSGGGNREDGLEVDALIEREVKSWYYRILDTANPELLPMKDIADDVTVEQGADGSAEIELPEGCRRVVGVKLEGWRRCARIEADPDSVEARMQVSPYICGGCWQPVAVKNGRRLHLYSSAQNRPRLEFLRCVMEPDDGTFKFDESLLGTISSVAEQL